MTYGKLCYKRFKRKLLKWIVYFFTIVFASKKVIIVNFCLKELKIYIFKFSKLCDRYIYKLTSILYCMYNQIKLKQIKCSRNNLQGRNYSRNSKEVLQTLVPLQMKPQVYFPKTRSKNCSQRPKVNRSHCWMNTAYLIQVISLILIISFEKLRACQVSQEYMMIVKLCVNKILSTKIKIFTN